MNHVIHLQCICEYTCDGFAWFPKLDLMSSNKSFKMQFTECLETHFGHNSLNNMVMYVYDVEPIARPHIGV